MQARALLGLVGLAGALWLGCEMGSTHSGSDHPLVGKKAPLFAGTLLDGSPFDLAQHLGQKVVILDFWATWCPPCREGLPTIAEVAAEYQGRGVEFFAIDCGESPEDVRQFLAQTGLRLTVVMDRDGAIGNLYQVDGIPQTVIIGKDGTVRVVHVGLTANLKSDLAHELDGLVDAGVPVGPERLAGNGRSAQ
jgi:thiol-disulfide isomerase/thioredoxin